MLGINSWNGRLCRRRSGAKQYIVSFVGFPIHRDFQTGEQLSIPLHHLDLVFFHQAGNPVSHRIHDFILVDVSLGEIEAHPLNLDAKNRTMLGMVKGLGCLKEGFGWHASFIQTNASELFLFHQQGLETRSGGFLGGYISGRTCTNHCKIIFHSLYLFFGL